MDFDNVAKPLCQTHYNRFTGLRQKKQQSQGKKVGNYRIGRKLGEGSNGFVYSAHRLEDNKKFAVKIIPRAEENLDSLENQMKILESICHKNIIKLQQVVSEQNKVFIFMEICSKGDLFCHIRNNGKLSEKQAAEIFIKIHTALEYLHDKGITHRDVKAENILLDESMNPILSDFGLAQFYNKTSPFLETWCGSFNYVAPQILKKKRYKPELIDLWSLCVTLYIMLAGKQPFNRDGDRIATKQYITTLDWDHDVQLSPEALDLFNSVFVPAQHRLRLREVKETLFYKKYLETLDKEPQKQVEFGLHSTLDIESQEEFKNMEKSQPITGRKSSKRKLSNLLDEPQFLKQFQSIIPKMNQSRIKSRMQFIKMFRESKGVRSVEPSNKFRVKKSVLKRKQSIQDL